MRMQAKHSNVFSFDHDEGSILQFAFEARKDPKQRDLNHQDQYRWTRTREDEQDEENKFIEKRNEDASKALKCFSFDHEMHVFSIMHFEQEMRTRAKHSNVFSFDHS